MDRMIQWESTPELNAFRLLDSDPTVIRFSEQPCAISYLQDGVVRSHVPDILIEYSDRKELWEVKVESEALTPEIAARTVLMHGLAPWGYTYKVVLAAKLAAQPRLNNAMYLQRFGGLRAVSPEERESIRQVLKRTGYLLWGDACRGIYGLHGREILCRLALEGLLSLDLTSVWTENTRFFAKKAAF